MFIGRFGAYVRYVNTEEREDVHSTLSNWSWGLFLDDVALCLPLRWKFPGCNGWRWSSRCPKWRLLALQGQAVLIKSLGSINPIICKGAVLHFPNERQPAIGTQDFGIFWPERPPLLPHPGQPEQLPSMWKSRWCKCVRGKCKCPRRPWRRRSWRYPKSRPKRIATPQKVTLHLQLWNPQ